MVAGVAAGRQPGRQKWGLTSRLWLLILFGGGGVEGSEERKRRLVPGVGW